MNKIIARKSNRKNEETGFIKPVYHFNSNNHFELVGNADIAKDIYANTGTVIVHKEFYQISQDFDDKEFFIIEIEETGNYQEFSPSSCKYQTKNGNTSTLKKLPMLIQSNIEDVLKDGIFLPYKNHKYVFVEDNESIYGPISILESNTTEETNWVKYKIEPLNTTDLSIDENLAQVVFKFSSNKLSEFIVKNSYGLNGMEEYISQIDFIVSKIDPEDILLTETDTSIITWAETYIPKAFPKQFPKIDSNEIVITSGRIDELRFKRFVGLNDKSVRWVNFIDSFLVNKYFNTEEGQDKIDQFIKNNKNKLLQDIEEELKTTAKQNQIELHKEVEELIEEKKGIESEIIKLKDDKDYLKSKSEELTKVENSISEKIKELERIENYEDLNKEYDVLFGFVNRLKQDKEKVTAELEELRNAYIEEANKGSHKKIVELMPYVKALSGVYPEEERDNKESIVLQKYSFKNVADINEIIIDLKQFLERNGRGLNEIEIANILTSVNQNFLTIFSGLPGVGKTSLANLLANYFCARDFAIEIPVGRGWSSKKNILGYYNPLKGTYQYDDYGFVKLLKSLNNNDKNLLERFPTHVILDEANLSPIEHYWSDFIGLCDKETGRYIQSNEFKDGKLFLPDGLRFILTVNNDHTTEMLSPRLIDRATILNIDYKYFDSIEVKKGDDETEENTSLNYEHLKSIFLPDEFSLNQSEKRVMNEIKDLFMEKNYKLGSQIPISPRKLKSIGRYCTTTRNIFNQYQENQFLALDYAILQNIIPLINGQGEGFKQRLSKLKDICLDKSLFKCADEIDNILLKGNDFKTYSFF
ncbi:hypothetical protein C3K47_08765 [Solitalea longa]|uniref:AAA+ ATPase domain-containing protein n=1 Tax=Solitalea longa TaxID=2079460 RepID=A0A2S5A4B2_9SPHI|nr:hypothetical protein [Solitalea longa]POY37139.1 hypothetical protein C3K47_08765 [Solitalea longa]